MKAKITALLASIALFGAGLFFGATPALASTIYNCPNYSVCLFDNLNYNTSSDWRIWGVTYIRDYNSAHCFNLPLDFDNMATSLIINNGEGGNVPTSNRISVYAGWSCNADTDHDYFVLSSDTLVPDLRTKNVSSNRISSIGFNQVG